MLFSCWCLVYTTTNLTNLDTPEFVNGPVLCIIIIISLRGHTSFKLMRHMSIDTWEQCNHTRKNELNRYLVHALEQPPISLEIFPDPAGRSSVETRPLHIQVGPGGLSPLRLVGGARSAPSRGNTPATRANCKETVASMAAAKHLVQPRGPFVRLVAGHHPEAGTDNRR